MAFRICIRLYLLAVAIQVQQVWSSASHRHRRSILQMYSQLVCQEGDCPPINYLGYGCYCGSGGGGTPVDEIDNSCRQHDLCYGQVASRCNHLDYYMEEYDWICIGGRASCKISQGLAHNDECLQQLCRCDEAFINSVQRYPCPEKKPDCKPNLDQNDVLHQISKFVDPYTNKYLKFSALQKLSQIKNRTRITLPILSPDTYKYMVKLLTSKPRTVL